MFYMYTCIYTRSRLYQSLCKPITKHCVHSSSIFYELILFLCCDRMWMIQFCYNQRQTFRAMVWPPMVCGITRNWLSSGPTTIAGASSNPEIRFTYFPAETSVSYATHTEIPCVCVCCCFRVYTCVDMCFENSYFLG